MARNERISESKSDLRRTQSSQSSTATAVTGRGAPVMKERPPNTSLLSTTIRPVSGSAGDSRATWPVSTM